MIPVLIIGKSGSGKSYSLNQIPTEGTIVVNVLNKPLPFRSRIESVACDDYRLIGAAIRKAKYQRYIIDDFGYLMTGQFMTALGTKKNGGDMFQNYADIGLTMWDFIREVQHCPTDARVYLMMHEDVDDFGNVKPRTPGKLVDQKICLEGMVTICLRCMTNVKGDHVFMTRTNGQDVTKTPVDMFTSAEIPNDLNLVDKAIIEYYDIKEATNNESGK